MAIIPKILVVEDNEADAELIRCEFSSCKLSNEMIVVSSFAEAVGFLDSESDLKASYILFVDIGLPRDDGFSIIQKLREAFPLHQFYSFILTGAPIEECISICYDRDIKADGFLQKPLRQNDITNIVKHINQLEATCGASSYGTNGRSS
jgi:CheY-like chemotaxis protein